MTDPEVVMLDEPMAGVNPALTQSLLGHIKSLRDDGMTVVFVEHDMDVIREVSDWVVVMAQGSVIAEAPPPRHCPATAPSSTPTSAAITTRHSSSTTRAIPSVRPQR